MIRERVHINFQCNLPSGCEDRCKKVMDENPSDGYSSPTAAILGRFPCGFFNVDVKRGEYSRFSMADAGFEPRLNVFSVKIEGK